MNIRKIVSGFLITALFGALFPYDAHASENSTAIKNVKILSIDKYVQMSWDDLPSDQKSNIEGYAIGWSESSFDLRLDKLARRYEGLNTGLEIWRDVTFDRDTDYYFRIFGFKMENGKRVNLYGSEIIKWRFDINNNIVSSIEQPNDPVIATTTTTTSDSESVFEFGVLRAITYDTMVRLAWSTPDLTDSELDNFRIIISENSDLTDPVLSANVNDSLNKARIDGLKPSTQYYAAGYFENNGATFGTKGTVNFKTYPLLDESGKAALARRLVSISSTEGFGVIIDAEQYEDTTVATTTATTTTSSTSTSTTSSSSSSSTTSARTNFEVPDNAADINDEIRAVRIELGALNRYRLQLLLKLREIQSE